MIRFDLQRFSFDSVKVQKELDRKTARALKRFGAFTRRTSQQSMRLKKEGDYSRPGQPLHSHGGQRYKKNILYAYEPTTKSVVIGPRLFPRTAKFRIPRLHEQGGADRRGRYEERPVMQPAFKKEIKGFRRFFQE